MADNQDYKDIEHMTDTDRNADDIDVLFKDDNNMKIIFPDKDELKDFPEERLNEDYISDDDLDFVDSMLEEENSQKENDVTSEKTEEPERKIEVPDVELSEPETSLNNIENIDLKIDTDNDQLDKIDGLDDIELKLASVEDIDLPSVNEEEKNEKTEILQVSDEEDAREEDTISPSDEDTISVSDDVEVTLDSDSEVEEVIQQAEEPENEKEVEQVIPEINSTNDDNDRIEIVVKNIDQDVILPPSEDEELSDDVLLGKQDNDLSESVKAEEVAETSFVSEEEKLSDDSLNETAETEENIPEKDETQGVVNENSENIRDNIIYLGEIKDNIKLAKDDEIETKENIQEETSELQFIDSDSKPDLTFTEQEIPINISKYGSQNTDFEIVEAEDEAQTEPSDDIEFLSFDETVITEEKEEKSEEEELLDENVFAVCNIDSKRGFYFGKSPKAYALYGYINDEIFMLKEFPELYNKNLGFRLQEKAKKMSSYLVKVNNSKLLINVDKETMSVVLEL